MSLRSLDVAHFEKHGWAGPFDLLSAAQVVMLNEVHRRYRPRCLPLQELGETSEHDGSAFAMRPWFKSMHMYGPEFFELAVNSMLVNRLHPVLGPNIVAWGLTTTVIEPGRGHRWHVDIEHTLFRSVTAFVGLENTTAHTTLTCAPSDRPVCPNAHPVVGGSNDD